MYQNLSIRRMDVLIAYQRNLPKDGQHFLLCILTPLLQLPILTPSLVIVASPLFLQGACSVDIEVLMGKG